MKIKNIAFFGVMASILSVAGAHAATTQTIIASKNYVDGKITGINTTLGDYATKTYADTAASNAQSAAISAAATDATSKANAAQAAAEATAAADATSKANAKVSSAATISADSTTTAPNEKAVSTALSGKASASDLTSHTGNGDIHVTAAQKTEWSGKQNAITEQNKLPAALVDGALTSSDISGKANTDLGNITTAGNTVIQNQAKSVAAQGTYSASTNYGTGTVGAAIKSKQDTISDLATIRSGAAAGATAVQPAAISDMETKTHASATYATQTALTNGLATKQNTITSTNKLPAANVDGLATVATSGKASDLNNDAGFLKAADISGKANTALDNLSDTGKANVSAQGTYSATATYGTGTVGAAIKSKASASDLTSHTGDTTVHITAAERTAWNGKQAALTTAQLAAANSGITAAKVSTYDGYASTISGKVNTAQGSDNKNKILITDNSGNVTTAASIANTQVTGLGSLATKSTIASADITDGTITSSDISSTAGITKTQLASAVQTSLGKADTALQSSDIAGKADKATNLTASGTTNKIVQYNSDGIIVAGTTAGSLATKNAVASADITDGTIVNADVSTSAAIAYTKMAAPTVDINGGTSVTCSSADPCVLSYDGSAYSWTKFVY